MKEKRYAIIVMTDRGDAIYGEPVIRSATSSKMAAAKLASELYIMLSKEIAYRLIHVIRINPLSNRGSTVIYHFKNNKHFKSNKYQGDYGLVISVSDISGNLRRMS